ncbi:tetratricopeptide repeat protein (plasmid) [Azospirillum sp. 412522]|nr:tetratricopeptide repeat-containing glycosyltransferase family protein [Azospirillum sp. 412522]MBY6266405.1 tetratricopeptide repeat protein [Azospirillum sp. 412522]
MTISDPFSKAIALHRAGRKAEAACEYRNTLAGEFDNYPATLNLGALRFEAGALDEATRLFGRTTLLNPGVRDAWHNLSTCLRQSKRGAEAEAPLRRALAIAPREAGLLNELGLLLESLRRPAEAAECFARAAALQPDNAEFQNNLAATLRMIHRFEPALAAIRRAVALEPGYGNAYNNMGSLLKGVGDFGGALASFRRSRLIAPDEAGAHWNESLILLLLGDFAQGWRKYEWRWRTGRFPSPQRNFTQPVWTGTPLAGRRLLVYWEQGFGDVLQFVRYLPFLAAIAGGPVILECQRELARLFKTIPGVEQVVETGGPLPAFDLRIPLLSLPLILGTRLETIPSRVPYLTAPAGLRDRWKTALGEGRDLKVGLIWAGNPGFADDPLRSPRLAAFAPVLKVPGVRFVSLQKGDGRRDLREVPLPDGFLDLGDETADFADSAAIMESLDLVISSCTSAAHLAGGLGIPLWVILPAVPDWRWLLDREDCPWYPSARLFRQSRAGEWAEVLERVSIALAELADGGTKAVQAGASGPENAFA